MSNYERISKRKAANELLVNGGVAAGQSEGLLDAVKEPLAYNPCDPVSPEAEADDEVFWSDTPDFSGLQLKEEPEPKAKVFDLEERTTAFGEAIIVFAKKIPRSPVNDRLISQLVGAGTSVGANYAEADDGVSQKDFKNKIGIARKEARETKFLLRMIAVAEPHLKPEARILWREAKELHLILCAIWRKVCTSAMGKVRLESQRLVPASGFRTSFVITHSCFVLI